VTPARRRRRYAELQALVREEDLPKLLDLDARAENVRWKHHPGSTDPDAEPSLFLPALDDELEEP